MSNALALFAVAAVAALSPIVMAFLVHKVTRTLLTSNKKIAELTAAANTETAASLTAIHTLVNSNLTEAQERELEATRAMLAAMREVIELKQDRGMSVAQETIDAVKAVEGRIGALSQKVEYKQEQTKLAEKLSEPKEV